MKLTKGDVVRFFARGREATGIVTDLPEHDPELVRVVRTEDLKGFWILRDRQVLEVLTTSTD